MKKLICVFWAFVMSFGIFCSVPFANISLAATENTKTLGSSSNFSLTLPSNLAIGKYTAKYEDANGILDEYGDICTFEVNSYGEEISYDRFIEANTAPVEATVIGIYNKSDEKVGEFNLNNLAAPNYGKKLYSFAAFSDVHIGSRTSEEDFQHALEYIENNSEIDFTAICGDFIQSISETSQLEKYKSIVDTYTTKPVYAISGNHEAASNSLGMEDLKPYTGQDLYYSFTHGNDVFIMLGNAGCTKDNLFADGELEWLYETLEANKDKRCFLFQHVRPDQGCGNPYGIDEYELWGGAEEKVFESLLAHYPNVIFFHGHTHDFPFANE